MRTIVKTSFLAALYLLLSQPAFAVQPTPIIDISRPAGSDPYLTISASKDYQRISLPYTRAPIVIKGPEGYLRKITADPLGVVRFDPTDILLVLRERPELLTIEVETELEGVRARKAVTVSEGELNNYFRQAAVKLKERGNELAGTGRMKDALELYKKSLEFDPLYDDASYNLAFAHEKLGMYHLAVSAYSNYLFTQPAATDRMKVKKKVIQLSKVMRPGPAIPIKAVELLGDGQKAVKERQYLKAIAIYEAAQSLAPWWKEPYYSTGLVFEFLGYQNNFEHYSHGALQNFNLFLDAAGKDDPRIADVKKRVKEIEDIREGLKAPEYIRIE